MIVGHVRDNFPRIAIRLPSVGQPINIEFIVDTGFDGELTLPAALIHNLNVTYKGHQTMRLADAFERTFPVYEVATDWNEERKSAIIYEIGGNPLLGVELLAGSLLQIEVTDGGEVSIEPL
jgi:clan AA aspartic protease